jgi:hypothetical protein
MSGDFIRYSKVSSIHANIQALNKTHPSGVPEEDGGVRWIQQRTLAGVAPVGGTAASQRHPPVARVQRTPPQHRACNTTGERTLISGWNRRGVIAPNWS